MSLKSIIARAKKIQADIDDAAADQREQDRITAAEKELQQQRDLRRAHPERYRYDKNKAAELSAKLRAAAEEHRRAQVFYTSGSKRKHR